MFQFFKKKDNEIEAQDKNLVPLDLRSELASDIFSGYKHASTTHHMFAENNPEKIISPVSHYVKLVEPIKCDEGSYKYTFVLSYDELKQRNTRILGISSIFIENRTGMIVNNVLVNGESIHPILLQETRYNMAVILQIPKGLFPNIYRGDNVNNVVTIDLIVDERCFPTPEPIVRVEYVQNIEDTERILQQPFLLSYSKMYTAHNMNRYRKGVYRYSVPSPQRKVSLLYGLYVALSNTSCKGMRLIYRDDTKNESDLYDVSAVYAKMKYISDTLPFLEQKKQYECFSLKVASCSHQVDEANFFQPGAINMQQVVQKGELILEVEVSHDPDDVQPPVMIACFGTQSSPYI